MVPKLTYVLTALATSILIFLGLPNHCKLEVVPSTAQAGQKVKIALQLEEGGRVIGEYSSNDTLDQVYDKALSKIEPKPDLQPVIIYMRQEFVGTELFSQTALKKLGLTGGSAVLRLIHRNPESLSDQASVVNITEVKKEKSELNWRPMKSEDNEANLKLFESVKPNEDVTKIESKIEPKIEEEKIEFKKPEIPRETKLDDDEPMEVENEVIETAKEALEDPILHILDDSNQILIYKSSDQGAKIRSVLDVSDDFFELTIEDAKLLLKDTRRAQKSEEKIMMTEEMRQTQKEGEKLAYLNKYKKAVIRIQLPDRNHIVQAIFESYATISGVLEKLQKYFKMAENAALFITPPKTTLDPSLNLLDHGLVPAALIYLSSDTFEIIEEYQDKISNVTGAELALSQAGILKNSVESKENGKYLMASNEDAGASSSNNQAAMKRPPTSKLPEKSDGKMPKWFKPSK